MAASVSVENMVDWAQEHVHSTLHGSPEYRRVAYRYILRFQEQYEDGHDGGCFLESLDSTDSIRKWLQRDAVRAYSPHTVRIWLFTVQRFTAWLFERERVEHDVLAYVPIAQAVAGEVEPLWLRHNLQRDIARFAAGNEAPKDRITRETCVLAAHSWNLHLNRRCAHQEAFPDFEESLFLEWLTGLAREARSIGRALACLKGLERFLDVLVAERGLPTHPLQEFRKRYTSRTAALRILRQSTATSPSEIRGALGPLRKTAFFQSGLSAWMEAYLLHRLGRGKKIDGLRTRLHILDQVLRRHGVERADHITAAVIEDFMGEYDASAGNRNRRLTAYRGFARFLQGRGEEAPLAAHGWELLPEPRDFRPHIFTLQEVGMLLQWIRARSKTSPHPFTWLAAEAVIYLLYACGMRLREPLMLRLQDVDLESRTLFIACAKFYKQRWVPFGVGTARRLAAYLELRGQAYPARNAAEDPFFLNWHGHSYSDQSVWRVFRDAVDALGICSRGTRPPRLHDMRHSMAVHRLYKWYADGADVQNKLPLLTTYLGHAKICSTQNYLHLTEDLLRLAGRGFQVTLEQVLGNWDDSHDPTP